MKDTCQFDIKGLLDNSYLKLLGLLDMIYAIIFRLIKSCAKLDFKNSLTVKIGYFFIVIASVTTYF